jgi:ACS family hexuronate transporter-like MFS transporter
MIPFIAADAGNILGGLFTQFLIKKGINISKSRKTTLFISGSLTAISLILGPLIITSPSIALAVLAVAGFGYASYTSNSMAVPGDIVPKNANASIWGLASVGSGLGGALFQFLSGITVDNLSKTYNYSIAYNSVFVGYGLLALASVIIMIFVIGAFEKDEKLFEVIDN